MGGLAQALPLAFSAAFYPPALLVLLLLLGGEQPRRLVLAYYAGAAIATVSSGLLALAVLQTAGLTTEDSSTASGSLYIAVGAVLLGIAPWAWRRRAHPPEQRRANQSAVRRRIATWSQRATTSRKWALVLGLGMFLPSPLYILAIKDIADSGSSGGDSVLAVLICAVAVMSFVEIPLIALYIRPDAVGSGIRRFDGWLKRNGWSLAAGIALIAGIYAVAKGLGTLS